MRRPDDVFQHAFPPINVLGHASGRIRKRFIGCHAFPVGRSEENLPCRAVDVRLVEPWTPEEPHPSPERRPNRMPQLMAELANCHHPFRSADFMSLRVIRFHESGDAG